MKYYCQSCGHPNESIKMPKFCNQCATAFGAASVSPIKATPKPQAPSIPKRTAPIRPTRQAHLEYEDDLDADEEADEENYYIPNIAKLDVEIEKDYVPKVKLGETLGGTKQKGKVVSNNVEQRSEQEVLEEFRREASTSRTNEK